MAAFWVGFNEVDSGFQFLGIPPKGEQAVTDLKEGAAKGVSNF